METFWTLIARSSSKPDGKVALPRDVVKRADREHGDGPQQADAEVVEVHADGLDVVDGLASRWRTGAADRLPGEHLRPVSQQRHQRVQPLQLRQLRLVLDLPDGEDDRRHVEPDAGEV